MAKLLVDRRRFVVTALATAVIAPSRLAAQPPGRAARIGLLVLDRAAPGDPRVLTTFFEELRDLGYVEGRNAVVVYRDAAGKTERFPALASELAAADVDVIVSFGGMLAALAAKRATTTVPIVFFAVGDPVSEGVVNSLARPGGNVTGLAVVVPDLISKSLELLKEAAPRVSRVVLLLKPDATSERVWKQRIEAADLAARALRLQLQVVEARGPADFVRAFGEMERMRADGLVVVGTPVFDRERGHIVALAAKHRLPAVYSFRRYVEAGGLMSYGPDLADLSRRAARYVDRILKGAKPADLPVEQPRKFDLVFNVKAADALGLTIAPSLLLRADYVIE